MLGQSWFCYTSWKGERADQMNLRNKTRGPPSTINFMTAVAAITIRLRSGTPRESLGQTSSLEAKANEPRRVVGGPSYKLGTWWRPLPARGVHTQFRCNKRSSDEGMQGESPLPQTSMGTRCNCCRESAQSFYSGARHCYSGTL